MVKHFNRVRQERYISEANMALKVNVVSNMQLLPVTAERFHFHLVGIMHFVPKKY